VKKSFSEDDKINPMKLDSYFTFMRGAKSANSKLFKDFCNEAEMKKNIQIVGFILSSSLRYYGILFIALSAVISSSCKKKIDPYADIKGNYFSINQYALDQWNTFSGEPFMIIKTIRINDGKPDSLLTNSDTLNWAPIFKVFSETDISNRKYLGQYTFTQFDDNQDETHNFYYVANDKDLFTQKLLLSIDQFTNKVKGIYIETIKKDIEGERTQKLYYAPLKTIQIQTDNIPILGDKKFTVVQYDFLG
jgi:hypothetical protein